MESKPYYFLHTLIGSHDKSFYRQMSARPNRPEHYKIFSFLNATPETPDGISYSMGLDLREVMCTVSKRVPAVSYHNNYGLILDGIVKKCFDNDSGCAVQEDGTYNNFCFDFTNKSTPDALVGEWYDNWLARDRPIWNEVVLAKGSRVIGAFHDPNRPPRFPDIRDESGLAYGEKYDKFIDKVRRCGLALIEFESRFGD